MPQLLKPMRLDPMLHTREASTMRSPCTVTKSSPGLAQLEKAHMQQRRPNAAKKKNNKLKKRMWAEEDKSIDRDN